MATLEAGTRTISKTDFFLNVLLSGGAGWSRCARFNRDPTGFVLRAPVGLTDFS